MILIYAYIFDYNLKDIYFKIWIFMNISYIYSHTFLITACNAFWDIFIHKISLDENTKWVCWQINIGFSLLISCRDTFLLLFHLSKWLFKVLGYEHFFFSHWKFSPTKSSPLLLTVLPTWVYSWQYTDSFVISNRLSECQSIICMPRIFILVKAHKLFSALSISNFNNSDIMERIRHEYDLNI